MLCFSRNARELRHSAVGPRRDRVGVGVNSGNFAELTLNESRSSVEWRETPKNKNEVLKVARPIAVEIHL